MGADALINAAKDLNPVKKLSDAADTVETAVGNAASSVADAAESAIAPAPAPAASSTPANRTPLNPQADDQYVATNQKRADIAQAQRLIATIESSTPQDKQVALGRYNLTPGRYAQLKMKAGWPLQPDDTKALEQERESVEGKAPETESSFATDPVAQVLTAGANSLTAMGGEVTVEALTKGAQALVNWVGSQELIDQAQKAAKIIAPNHPNLAAVGGTLAGIATLMKLGSPGGAAESAAGGEGSVAAEAEPAGGEPGGSATEPPIEPEPRQAAEPEVMEGPAGASATAKSANPESAAGAETQTEAGGTASAPSSSDAGEHSDIAAIENAASNPMTKEEFEKIEFKPGGEAGEHPELISQVGWADRFRAMEYGGQLADNAIVARRRAAMTGADEDNAAVEAADKELQDALPRAAAIRHETGLALQKLGASPGAQQLKAVFEAMADNESTPTRLSQMLGNLPTIAERTKMLDDAANLTPANWSAKEAFYNLFVNTKLSLNSVGKKAVSDLANIAWQVPARGLAEIGSRAGELATGNDYGTMGVAPGETHAIITGMMENWGNALRLGLDSVREGKPMFEGDVGFIDNPALADKMTQGVMQGSGFENTWWGKAIDYYGHAVSIPGRSIIGVDQFAKSMQYNMELETLMQRAAFNEASAQGLEGDEFAEHVADMKNQFTEKTPGWMTDQAMQTAKVNTFQEDLQGSLAKIDAMRRSSYLARTLVPFFKTPTNITLQAIRQSPFAVLSPAFRSTVAGGGPEAAIALSKAAMGSAIMAYFTDKALKGHMTGAIPANLKGTMRDDWLRDNQPYSIKSGDGTWTSYEGLEPISWMMGMAADTAPMWSYLNQGEADHAVGTLARAAINEMGRQPMWGALHMVVNAFDDLERGRTTSLGQAGSRMAASLLPIPQSVSNLGGAIDPVRRQTNDTIDEMRERIPWLKKDGLATLDSFGKPVIVPPGFLANEFPAYIRAEKGADPVVDEISRLAGTVGFQTPQIPKAVGGAVDTGNLDAPDMQTYGAPVNPAQQNRWLELRGNPAPGQLPKLYDAVSKLMKQPQYESASDSQRANLLHMVFTGYQKLGEQRLLAEDSNLRGQMIAAYVGKGAARAAGRPGAGGLTSAAAP